MAARFINLENSSQLSLSYERQSITLVDISNVFCLSLKSLTLTHVTKANSQGEKSSNFELFATTDFQIAGLHQIKSTLSFESDETGRKIALSAETDPLVLPPIVFPSISSASSAPAIVLTLSEINLLYQPKNGISQKVDNGTSDGTDSNSGFEFRAKSHIQLENFSPFDSVLEKNYKGELVIASDSLLVSCLVTESQTKKKGPSLDWKIGNATNFSSLAPEITIRSVGFGNSAKNRT